MKLLQNLCAAALVIGGLGFQAHAQNYAWPANFEGVMLQGFYWDSFKGTDNTKWTTLTSRADELSSYFKVIWVPNSAKSASSPSMGYDPVYWFSNHNSSFGTEAEIRQLIKTFKEKGTDIIEDVVINHRSGRSNWTNFPAETWNGVTYQLGPEHICSNDEVAGATGQAKPTGAYDTGEGFNGSRDLDHTSTTVQQNCIAYCRFLLEDMGYAGFRYDMTKGYSGQYTKIYNEASKPKYSVGEYWDGNYDAVKAWIDATGKQSAAFDFPCKYAINDAFSSNDMTKLVWNANGTTPQPAGLIHFAYPQYAVTFIDNHDTYRDGNKFTGNVVAANAFILCSPGTPCVFYPHYSANKAAIQKLIAIRNAVGVHNMSKVTVLQTSRDCYMAEVIGSKGKLVVKIGSAMVSPSGYSDSDIKASGKDYCIWTKTDVNLGGGSNDDPVITPSTGDLYIIGNVNGVNWSTTQGVKQSSESGNVYVWNDVNFSDSGDGFAYFAFARTLGDDWDAVNCGDRYGATSKDTPLSIGTQIDVKKYEANVDASASKSWKVTPGNYSITLNLNTNKVSISIPSGVEAIDAEESFNSAPVYFNLQGQRVDNPEHGLYIMVQAGKSSRIMIP